MNLGRFFQRFRDRKRKDEDLAEEIASHLAHEQDANSARGLSAEEAHRQAKVKFGNPHSTRERVWRYRSVPWVEDAMARPSFRRTLARQDSRLHGHRHSRDRRGHRSQYCRLLRDQHRAAQAAYLS